MILQQQRQNALEQQLTPSAPDIILSPQPSGAGRLAFPAESPCFQIDRVVLRGAEALPHWLPLQRISHQAVGQCLGGNGINQLMGVLQNRLIDHGYITTRVLAPPQDLSSGELALAIISGRLGGIMLTPDSDNAITLYGAFPARAGQVLDLRDIEQGMENLQRLPTVSASMDILPGTEPGESDVLLRWQQSRMWRIGASLDDSGTRSTGRYQGGVTLSLDNPLSLSDLAYVSVGKSLKKRGEKGSDNLTASYSLPFGYWGASLTANRYDYHQTQAGLNGDYRYSGASQRLNFQLSRLLHRNSTQKTSLTYDVLARESKNFLDDTEIEVQRRRTSAWKMGLQHRHYLARSVLDTGISYQRGTRWFGALPAPEESSARATALSKIIQISARLDLPFELQNQRFRYNAQYQRQTSNTPLTPQEQFAIGSRWSVRGFDGERSLNADRGWFVRNELGWVTPFAQQEAYLGVDYGKVGGRGEDNRLGNHLAGGAVGMRGQAFSTAYDLFAAIPLSKPDGFRTDPFSLGFMLSWQY